jgi:ubiquinone/menaquinone biosynthesis C-methylase UbiE
MLKKFIERQELYKSLHAVLSADTSKQETTADWLAELTPGISQPADILDLGCGKGDSVEFFSRLMPDTRWHGVDIEGSPEAQSRTRSNPNIDSFDGINLPYGSDTFDIIYCQQVLEHVRHPDQLLPEVMRTLKPGGVFVGSVSYLEPFHSRSIFNFTPYGLNRVLQDAGLALVEIRPGIDAISLIVRQMLGGPRFLNFLFRSSPVNLVIGLAGFAFGLPTKMTAFLKVQYCGQFCFLVTRQVRSSAGSSARQSVDTPCSSESEH